MGIAVTLRSVFCRPFFAAPFTLGGVPGCVRELFPSCILPACIRFTKASLTTFSGMLKNCCGGEFFSVRHSAGGGCKATGGRTLLARHVLCVMGAGGLFLPGPQKSPGPPSRPKCRAERTLFHSLSERRGLFLRGRQKSPFLRAKKAKKVGHGRRTNCRKTSAIGADELICVQKLVRKKRRMSNPGFLLFGVDTKKSGGGGSFTLVGRCAMIRRLVFSLD